MSAITIDKLLGIQYPLIVAPMFLISNTRMVKAALNAGVTAAFPALNYRTDAELRKAIAEIVILNDEIREMIVDRAPSRIIREAAQKSGTRFLRESALDIVRSGDTSLKEINRVTFVS